MYIYECVYYIVFNIPFQKRKKYLRNKFKKTYGFMFLIARNRSDLFAGW